ncbi:hypothetical protein FB451DRAFT_1569831 [Mycena latifolia]|nr:hypothetical protein FB451DRAFT_1569831 [Mycena latifolia]
MRWRAVDEVRAEDVITCIEVIRTVNELARALNDGGAGGSLHELDPVVPRFLSIRISFAQRTCQLQLALTPPSSVHARSSVGSNAHEGSGQQLHSHLCLFMTPHFQLAHQASFGAIESTWGIRTRGASRSVHSSKRCVPNESPISHQEQRCETRARKAHSARRPHAARAGTLANPRGVVRARLAVWCRARPSVVRTGELTEARLGQRRQGRRASPRRESVRMRA